MCRWMPDFQTKESRFILNDAGVGLIVSQSQFREKLASFPVATIYVDSAEREIGESATARLTERGKPAPRGELAYLIYTSGTTGNAEGRRDRAFEHLQFCQGRGRSVRHASGRSLLSGHDDRLRLLGRGIVGSALGRRNACPRKARNEPRRQANSPISCGEQHVTVLCCVPTLLATIESDLPELRTLLVSGEACPHHLVVRWHQPGRTILNAYGPTEATVTATLTELRPDKPVTIGRPLPTYSIVILDPDKDKIVDAGTLGEIGIAGIGLANGYLNRARPDGEEIHSRFPGHREQSLGPHLSHRRPRPDQRRSTRSNFTAASIRRSRFGAIASN